MVNDIFLITSNDGIIPEAELIGYAFTYDSFVIGNDGFRTYRKENSVRFDDINEGRFIFLLFEDDIYKIKTDSMGQDMLYYYDSFDFWAVSNSFYKLCLAVKQANAPINIYLPALLSYFINQGNGLGAQPISNNTAIEQIKVLPIGGEIRIKKQDRKMYIFKPEIEEADKPEYNEEQYKEALISYVKRWLPRINALLNGPFEEVVADISGGYDSRMILGLLIASGIDLKKINFFTDETKISDYPIAKKIAQYYDLNINKKNKFPCSIEAYDAYQAWKYGSVGGYLPIYYPSHYRQTNSIQIKGDGGEITRRFYKGFYKHSPEITSKRMKRFFPDKTFLCLVQNEFIESFNDICFEHQDPFAMNAYYSNFRSRFHFGRQWYRSLRRPPFTPLICPSLRDTMRALTPDMLNTRQTVCDFLVLLAPELAKIPFDKNEKEFPSNMLQGSPFWSNKKSFIDNKAFKPLKLYYSTPGNQDYKIQKPSDPINDKRFLDFFLADYKELKYKALSLGIFNDDYLKAADEEIKTCTKISHDLRRATHIFYAGSIVDICRW